MPKDAPIKTEAEDVLSQLIRKIQLEKRIEQYKFNTKDWDLNMLPLPEQPAGFRPKTLGPVQIPGQTDPWETLRHIVPELDGAVKQIQYGPNAEAAEIWLKSSPPTPMLGTTLLGAYSRPTDTIALNPDILAKYQQDYSSLATLAHEFGHDFGLSHAFKPDNKQLLEIEKLANQVTDEQMADKKRKQAYLKRVLMGER